MAELECIVADGYDREVFAGILVRNAAVAKAKDRLERVLPNGRILLQDLFSALYKLNIVLRKPPELSGAVLLHRRLLEAVLKSRAIAELRQRTELSESECAAALPTLADGVLAALTREYRFEAAELADLEDMAKDEDKVRALEGELAHLDELPESAVGKAEKLALEKSLEQDIKSLKKDLEAARERQAALAGRLTTEIEDRVELKVGQLPEQIDEVSEHLRGLGIGAGGDGRVSAERRIELGERLMRSKKLQLLARLVGAFREVAFEARRRRIARTPQELHEVNMGNHLERLLPSELLGLGKRRRALHLEFLRRLVEGQLLEYELHGPSSRGPMVVCVDGSGSMSGSKELWAKAVALTMMEIARRERRRCLALVFSSGGPLAEFEFLSARGRGTRARVRDEEVLRFAEHFPGGGTSFEEPLTRAVEAVSSGDYRRGDIIFITDGEAQVTPALIETLEREKKAHRFTIHGILVDVAASSTETLDAFSDDVRRVTDLTADSLTDLFSEV